MKTLLTWMFIIVIAIGGGIWYNPDLFADLGLTEGGHDRIIRAYENRESNIIVETDARVVLLFPRETDVSGDFQKFRVELKNGHTLLVSNDLEISRNVPVAAGSKIRLRGEYDWTSRGGIIHWTHRDPMGQREGGWIEYRGRTYR